VIHVARDEQQGPLFAAAQHFREANGEAATAFEIGLPQRDADHPRRGRQRGQER
jgi:hypothetical protein